jgi:hypothetical protein
MGSCDRNGMESNIRHVVSAEQDTNSGKKNSRMAAGQRGQWIEHESCESRLLETIFVLIITVVTSTSSFDRNLSIPPKSTPLLFL